MSSRVCNRTLTMRGREENYETLASFNSGKVGDKTRSKIMELEKEKDRSQKRQGIDCLLKPQSESVQLQADHSSMNRFRTPGLQKCNIYFH